MERKRATGCIFLDTPKECSQVINGKCLGLGKLHCIFNHQHLIIAEDAKPELMDLLNKELDATKRYKNLSGQMGRPG